MTDQWYYMHMGRQSGPVSREELKQLVASGQLRGTDEVWQQGTTDWKPIQSIPDLAQALPPADSAVSTPLPGRSVSDLRTPVKPPAGEGEASGGLGIWSSFVKFRGRSGEYVLALDAQGINAAPVELHGKVPAGLTPFSLTWSELSSAEQQYGFFHWGIVFHLTSAERCEVWLLYEHFHPSVFLKIKEEFSDRISFRARPMPNWRVTAIPLGLALFFGTVGVWAYRGLGSAGVAVLFSLPVLACLVYAVWVVKRPHRS
jgi:hypothetical protein